jgi:hypothetical protein
MVAIVIIDIKNNQIKDKKKKLFKKYGIIKYSIVSLMPDRAEKKNSMYLSRLI